MKMRYFNSAGALYIAVGILFLTVAIGFYLDMKNDTMFARHLEISIGLEKIARLDQELSSMLLLSVVERNTLRTTRYDTVHYDFLNTLKMIADLTKNENINQDILALSENHNQIYTQEKNAIQFMKSDKWNEARDLLFGDDYSITKETYEVDIETITLAIQGEVAATEHRFTRIKAVSQFIRITALLFLVWTGVMFSRRIRADMAEQVRLRSEILDANKLLEKRVIERTEELRLLLHSVGEGIFGVDIMGKITFVNPAALTLLGFLEEEIIGQKVHPLIHHSYAGGLPYPVETCPMFKSFTEGTPHHVEDEVLWRKDGRSFPVEYSSTPMEKDGRVVGAVITFRDITERKVAEERFSALLESAPDAMIVSDKVGNITLVNSQTEEIFGYSREELIGQKIEMLVPEEIRDAHPGYRTKFYTDPQRLSMGFRGDFYGITKDGRKMPIDIGLSPIETAEGFLVVASIRDITERKKMEDAIKESEERVKTILDSINTGIIVIDEEKRTIVDVNPVAEQMIGLPKKDIIGSLCHRFICPREMNDCPIIDHDQIVDNADRVLFNAEGKEIPILKTVVRVILDGMPHLVESFVDLTERKQAEAELQRNFEELEKFNQLTIGREEKMISLKEEINELLGKIGKGPKYKIVQ